ncbi:MAG: DUF2070 family protein, partial [Candidatus Micrarchaeota archaeon]|nr:DUF2070 family protein [Candidatus Micrarchaeota archaeon]
MQKAKKEALMLTKYFVCLPHPAKTSLFILAVSFIFGIMFSIARKQPLGPFELFAAGVDGIFVLAIPSMLSALCLFFMRRKATFRRSAFMGLISVFIYGPFYLAASALAPVGEWASNLVFLGFAFSFGIWFFTLFLVFDFRRSAFLFAAIQAIFFALFFLIQGGFPAEANFQELLLKIYFASFVLLALFYSLFYFVSLPLKKNLGISSFDALSMFASQWLYGDTSLEEAFEEIGEEAETLVWVGKFQGRKNSAIFVVPHIHFGPFGNLGGSEFTYRISQLLSSPGPKKSEVFVFHGTATHDLNPVSSSEISKVIAACRLALSRLKLQEAKMAHSWCKVGSVRAQAFYLNDSAFLSFSRAPQTTEDVSLGLGLAVMERAKRICSTVAVVDEHNSETGDISS